VKRGDTLSGISKNVYGRSADWQKIFEANRDQLPSTDRLKPGMVLVIP
jgi:nucleoid-associated protein YgaU